MEKGGMNIFMMGIKRLVFVIYVVMFFSVTMGQNFKQTEREELIKQWAPIVWLHSNEIFYPGSVVDFLQNVNPSNRNRGYQRFISPGNADVVLPLLPGGESSWDTYLVASYNTGCRDCPKPDFFYGRKPGIDTTPPTYAVIHSCSIHRGKREYSTDTETGLGGVLNDEEMTEESYIFENDNLEEKDKSKYKGHSVTNDSISSTSNTNSAGEAVQSIRNIQLATEYKEINTSQTKHNDTDEIDDLHHNLTQPSLGRNLLHSSQYPNVNQSNQGHNLIQSSQWHNLKHSSRGHNLSQSSQGHNITQTNQVHSLSQSNQSHNISQSNQGQSLLQTNQYHNLTQNNRGHNLSQSNQGHKLLQTNQGHNLLQSNQGHNLSQTNQGHNFTQSSQGTRLKRNNFGITYDQFSVTYWMFYPYNYAKKICTTNLGIFGRFIRPTKDGVCNGEVVGMGNHVGDWEHITIQFRGSTPTKLYISSHSFGAFYAYDPRYHVFRYISQDTRKGMSLSPKYPSFLTLRENHPIVFSALGSHGLWPNSGVHKYNNFPELHDKTDFGTPWQTWENLEIINPKQAHTLTPIQRHWLSYEGYWGNPKSKCYILMGGFCENNHGPTGIPRKRINFPCPT